MSAAELDRVAAGALARVTSWINRAAGQHRRAIAASFAEARAALEPQEGGAR